MVCYPSLPPLPSSRAMTGRSRWSTFTVIVLAVTAAGLLLLAWLALRGGVQAALAAPPAFWLFVVFLAVGQVRPIVLPKRGPAEEIATSTTFTLALLLGWGLGPAALALVAGSVTGDLVARKPPKKLLFNAAQLTLAMGAAGAVLRLLGGRPPFSTGQLPAFALAAAVYFVVNKTLVRVVVALARSASVWHTLWESRVVVLPEAILVAMAPVAVVLAQRSVLLVLLLPLPIRRGSPRRSRRSPAASRRASASRTTCWRRSRTSCGRRWPACSVRSQRWSSAATC